MWRWMKKNRWLALGLVAVMLFTLLPTSFNWANITNVAPDEMTSGTEAGTVSETEKTEESEAASEATTEVLTEEVSTVDTENQQTAKESLLNNDTVEKGGNGENSKIDETESTDNSANIGSETTSEESTELLHNDPNQAISNNQNISIKEPSRIAEKKKNTDVVGASYTVNDKGSLSGYITDVTIEHDNESRTPVDKQNPAKPGEIVIIDYTFDLSQVELQPGDRYTITIPQEYCHLVQVTDEPLIYDGVQIGTYSISSDGVVSVTFNENITQKQGVCGEFWVGCQLSEDKIGDRDQIEIDVTDGVKEPETIDIYQQSKIPEIKKSSSTNSDGQIVWRIEITKNGADLKGMEIVDQLLLGQKYVSASVWKRKDWKDEPVNNSLYTITENEGKFDLKFNENLDADYVYLEIVTTLDDEDKPAEDMTLEIPNEAVLKTESGDYSASANYNYRTDRISKTGSYDKTTGEITWTITVNSNKENLKDVKVEDQLATVLSGYELLGDISISPSNSQAGKSATSFPVTLGNITGTYTLTFKTKSKTGASLNGSVTNKAGLSVDGKEVGTADATVSNTVGDYVEKSGSYNYGSKKMDWTITVNQDFQTLTNGILKDTVREGHFLDESSIQITVKKSDGSQQTYDYKNFPGELTTTETGFTWNLPSPTTDSYVITYSTSIDASAINGESVGGKTFFNDATFKVDEKTEEEKVTASIPVWDSMVILKKNAGDYDYSTQQIKWEIIVNENNAKFSGDVTVKDTLGEGQEFVENSLVVEKWVGGAEWEGGHWEEVTVSAKNFPITLSNIQEKYRITYSSKVDTSKWPEDGKAIEYTNEVTLETKGGTTTKTAKKTVEQPGLKKEGIIKENNVEQPVIEWHIDINRKKQTLRAGVIHDTLNMSLEMIEDSIHLYKVSELDADGNVKTLGNEVTGKDWYTYNPLTHYFEIRLPEGTSDTYRLIYQTKVINKSSSVTNKASFTGESPTEDSESTVGNLKSSLSGAVVTYKYAKLEIIKKDAANGTALDGVIFGLYDNENELLGELDPTDKDGRTTFEGVVVGRNYTLVEKATKEGYKLDGIARTFKAEAEGQVITYTILNKKESTSGEIEIYKKDDASPAQPVEGATFGLWYGTTATGEPAMTVTTDSEGKATFYSVDLDKEYVIKEISAPTGYTLSEESESGTLTASQPTAYYEFTNVREIGRLKVHKVDENGTPLSKVALALYKKAATGEEDILIGTKTTDNDGYVVFTDLEYGDYYLVEANVPKGYWIGSDANLGSRTNPIKITDNKELSWTVKNTAVKGRVVITKTDVLNSEKKLAGAEFTLWKVENGDKTFVKKDITGTDGTITFDNLDCGSYIVKETKAPEGYILNDKNVKEFEITGKEELDKNGKVILNYTFTDAEQNARLEFYKKDQHGKALSAGITFTIYDQYGDKVIATASPDATGKVVFDKLKWGTYILRETKTPNEYNRYPDDIVITIDENGTYGIPTDIVKDNIIVNTDKLPPFFSFKFIKKDNADKPLEGAVFVAKAGDKVIATAISDEEGRVFFQKVESEKIPVNQDVIIYETVSKAGYQLKTEPIASIPYTSLDQYVDNDDGTITVETAKNVLSVLNPALGGEVINEPIIGSLQITKTETGKATQKVSGASYGLYTDAACNNLFQNTAGNYSNPVATDVNGTVTFKNLPFGVYYVKETEAAPGYTLDPEVHKVVISKHYVATDDKTMEKLDVTDDKIYGTVVLYKRDKDSNALLEGAKFKLYKKPGTTYEEVPAEQYKLVERGGVYTFSNLEYDGEYYVKETEAPKGYNIDNSGYIKISEFTEANSYTVSETITDTKISGKIKISKVDATNTATVLSGAEFTITYPNGTTRSVTTDANGNAEFDNLPYLNNDEVYVVKETKAPAGYALDGTVYEITQDDFNKMATDGVIKTLTVKNQKKKAQIKITKRDSASKALLAGAEFTLYQYDTATRQYNETAVATAVTNKAGVATFDLTDDMAKPGTQFKAVETKSPVGYCLSKNTFHEFKLLENVTEYTWDVTNTKVVAMLQVTKQDKDTGEKLQGAEFTLYDVNKEPLDSKLTGSTGYARFTNLAAGAYWLKETKAPDGYQLDTVYDKMTSSNADMYSVLIKDGSQGEVAVYNTTYTVLAENTKSPDSRISIKKTDSADGAALAGAEFTIYQADGVTPVPDYSPATVITDEQGNAVFENLPYGDYVIKETNAPAHYATPSFTQEVTLSEEKNEVAIDVENTLLDENGTVSVTKVDSADQSVVLPGAEFTIYNSNNEAVKTITTDKSGKASAVLPYGSYSMVETKAPEGYELGETRYTFTISEEEKQFTYTVDNVKVISATVQIYKTDDSKEKKPLKDAEFAIYRDDEEIAKGKTDEKGYVAFDNLLAGTYVIKETKAPKGYEISDSARKITINENKEYEYSFVNKKKEEYDSKNTEEEKEETDTKTAKKTDSKKTGDSAPIPFAGTLFFLSLAGAGTAYGLRRKKARRK